MTKKKLIIEDFEEVLERDVKDFGNSSHIILPKEHARKNATIVIKKGKTKGNNQVKETIEQKEKRVTKFLAGKGGEVSIHDVRELMANKKAKEVK